jgi:integrase
MARDKAVLNHWFVPALGRRAIGSITPHDVRTIVKAMTKAGLAPRTVSTNYGVLRGAMSAAVDAQLIAVNPCRGVKLPEVPKVAKPVALVSEVHRLADAVPDDYRPAIYLGSLGLREAEVFGLKVKAIDFLRKTVTIEETINEVNGQLVVGDGKTRSSVRTISLPDFIVSVLADHLQRTSRVKPDDYVLQAPDGGPVRANNFRRRVYRPAIEKAGLDSGLTFHRLRHSAGHHMRETGEPLEVIQKRLGHASIRTTADVYGSLPVAVDKAASDRLNAVYEAMYESSRGHIADIDDEQSTA